MHDHVMPIVDELTEGLALDGGVGIHDAGQFNIDRMFFATNSAGVFQRDTAIPGRMHEVGKERESPVFSRPKPGVRIGFTFLYPFEKYRRSLFLTVRIDTGKIDGIGYGGFLQPDFLLRLRRERKFTQRYSVSLLPELPESAVVDPAAGAPLAKTSVENCTKVAVNSMNSPFSRDLATSPH